MSVTEEEIIEELEECRMGNHSLKVALRTSAAHLGERVVRWCQTCGSIVIDLDTDERIAPGYFQTMTSPRVMVVAKKR